MVETVGKILVATHGSTDQMVHSDLPCLSGKIIQEVPHTTNNRGTGTTISKSLRGHHVNAKSGGIPIYRTSKVLTDILARMESIKD